MQRDTILQALSGTLDPLPETRRAAETQLAECERQPGFTAYCLELATDAAVQPAQRSSAAVFFKNRVYSYWGAQSERGIRAEEQAQIKQQLIEALVKTYQDSHIRPQLTVAVKHILNRGEWALNEPVYHLLANDSDPAYRYTGLVLLLEAIKSLRYKYQEQDRLPLNNYVSQMFPVLEKCASELIQQDDYRSGEMMYYILKIFKYSTLVSLPHYLHELQNLETWISLHLALTQKPLPQEVLGLDPEDRVLDKRVKCQKWAFGNLQRFYQKFCTPTAKNASPEFIEYFNKNYVPRILQTYFTIVESWGSGSWLSDASLFNLICFSEKCTITDVWPMIQPHYNAIFKHLIFPCLCQKDLELFEDDQEEYIRRFFDINRESSTADIAAVDLLFVTAHHRFEEIPGVLALLNEVFSNFQQDPSLQSALKVEGALRVLSSISFSLTKPESPVSSQIDQMIDNLIVPFLSGQYDFLKARACETISIFAHDYKDKEVLSRVYQSVYSNFNNNDCMAIKIEAADALKVLITDSLVIDAIRPNVPYIMQSLLELSKMFELDMLAEIMEAFVETFSEELEPFALDMGTSLCAQFVQTAQEMIELQNNPSGGNAEDKEYQAIGFINTMTTMTMSMTKVDLEPVFLPAVKFVVESGSIAFLTEAMELTESLISASRKVSQSTWSIFDMVIDSFQTYAAEFFETYIPFFEAIILFGFKGMSPDAPQVVSLKAVIHELIESPVDYDNVGAFELVEYMTLTFGQYSEDLPLIIQKFREEELAPNSVIRVLLASLYVAPDRALMATESTNDTVRLLEIWYNLSATFETVYGLKLQILALLSFFALPTIPESLLGFLPQLALKLVTCVERLPAAIQKRQEQMKIGYVTSLDDDEEEGGFEAEEDVFKTTPLDELNAFLEFSNRFKSIESNMPERYQQIVGSLPNEKLENIKNVIKFVEEHPN